MPVGSVDADSQERPAEGDQGPSSDITYAMISGAARSPATMAPPISPAETEDVSVEAQWIRPTGARQAAPKAVQVPGTAPMVAQPALGATRSHMAG